MVCTIDIRRAFPSADKHVVAEVLRAEGVRGELFNAIMAMISNGKFRPGLRRGVDGGDVSADVGLFEGAVLSPRLFSLLLNPLARKLRSLGYGVEFRGQWIGALYYMDDIVLIANTEEEMNSALDVVLAWAFRFRMLVNSGKTHVMATRPNDQALPRLPKRITRTWTPQRVRAVPRDVGPDPARVELDLEVETSLVYLGIRFGVEISDMFKAHHESRQMQTYRDLRRALEARRDTEYMSLATMLDPLLQYARNLVCDVAALPALTDGQAGYVNRLDALGMSVALGDAVPTRKGAFLPMAPIAHVFGIGSSAGHILYRRLMFAYALDASRRRPERRALVDGIVAEVAGMYAKDRDRTVTGAIFKAIKQASALELPPKRGPGVRAGASARCDNDTINARDGPRPDVPRPPRAPEHWPDSSGVKRGVWKAWARRAQRLFDRREKRRQLWSLETGLKTAGILRAMTNGGYGPTRKYLKSIARKPLADHPHSAQVAATAGVWWMAPLTTMPPIPGVDVGSDWRYQRCALAGCTVRSMQPMSHLIYGKVDGEEKCGGDRCTGNAFLAQAIAIVTAHKRSALLQTLPDGSLKRLAFLLGGRQGTKPALSAALVRAFVRTWGVLSRDLRRSAGNSRV